jgi:hypothetical protein
VAFQQWLAGEQITADRLASISPVWADWTPTWTTATGSATPSFGDATITARYAQSADIVFWRMEITFGATTNFGGGGAGDNWRFSMPVTASSIALVAGSGEIGDATASVGSRLRVRCRLTTTTTVELETSSGRVDATALTTPNWGIVDAVSPWTWAASDFMRVSGFYEAA